MEGEAESRLPDVIEITTMRLGTAVPKLQSSFLDISLPITWASCWLFVIGFIVGAWVYS